MIFKEIKAPAVNVEDPLVLKFREIIVESLVMLNIKIVSGLKFSFAKVREERNKKLAVKAPSIHPDINSINGWLL